MPWTDQVIHFLDFEGSLASGVLEFGVVSLQRGEVVATSTRLCAPHGPIRPSDTEVHGLSEASLGGSAPMSDDWELFAGWRDRGPFAAHYAGVENSLLRAVWPYPRRSPDFARPGESIVDWGPWIDTARLYAQFYPALDSGRLESLVAASGLQGELDALAHSRCPASRRRYHAALYDALAGALLLISIGRQPRLCDLTTTQLLALSTLDPIKRESILQRELF